MGLTKLWFRLRVTKAMPSFESPRDDHEDQDEHNAGCDGGEKNDEKMFLGNCSVHTGAYSTADLCQRGRRAMIMSNDQQEDGSS
jgi:hypothetical protein